MNRTSYLAARQRLSEQVPVFNGSPIEPVSDKKDENPLLNYIYSVDQHGNPVGDVAMFLGDDTRDEVKQFIKQNLLTPVNDSSSGLSLPVEVVNKMRSTISDDDIAKFSRSRDESVEEYAYRLRQHFDDIRTKNIQEVRRQKTLAELRKLGIEDY